MIAIFVAVSVIVAAVLAFLLFVLLKRLSSPLAKLTESTERLAAGDYTAHAEEKGGREFVALAKSFNNMTERISEQIAELEVVADQKQQLVDNLSHEMRTPLTSIHGYAEYLLGAAVDEEEESHAGTMIRFVNAVAEAVEKEFPNAIIETLAYQYTRKPPKKTRLRHNVVPCLCTIECDFSRPLATSPCPDNVSFLKDVEDWNRQTDFLYVWDYVTDFRCYPHPFPNVYVLQENVKFFRDHGVKMRWYPSARQNTNNDSESGAESAAEASK
jgi:HAMP domain-containing protein